MKNIFLLTLFLLTLASCGKIKKINFFVDQQEEREDFVLEATINSTSYQLPIFNLPIYDFQKGYFLGEIEVDSSNTIKLRLHSHLLGEINYYTDWVLPNGKAIPYRMSSDAKPFVLQIGNTNSRIYLSLNDDNSILGLALNIDNLPPTNEPGAINALIPFSKNNISGVMGLYLSDHVGKNGFAIFIDITQKINQYKGILPKKNTFNNPKPSSSDNQKKVYKHVKKYLKNQNSRLH